MKRSIKGFADSFNGVERSIKGFAESFNGVKRSIKGFAESFNGVRRSIKTLKHSIKVFAERFKRLKRSIKVFAERFKRLKRSIKGFAERFKRLKRSIKVFAERFKRLKRSIKVFAERFKRLKRSIKVFAERFRRLKRSIKGFAERFKRLKRSIKGFAERFKRLKRSIKVFAERFKRLKRSIKVFAERFKRLKRSIKVFAERFKRLKRSIKVFAERFKTLKRSIEGFAGRFERLKRSVNAFTESFTRLKRSIDRFTEPIRQLKRSFTRFALSSSRLASSAAPFDAPSTCLEYGARWRFTMSIRTCTWLRGALGVSGLVLATQGCSGSADVPITEGDAGGDSATGGHADSGKPADASTHADVQPHDAPVSSDGGTKPDGSVHDSSVKGDAAVPDSSTKPDSGPGDATVTPDSGKMDSATKADASGGDAGTDAMGTDAGPSCSIGGVQYVNGAANPSNACQSCQPATTSSAWSNLADGTACGSGSVCQSGTCTSGCEIGGAFYADTTANPANACQSCQAAKSTSAWSDLADGTTCGNDQICAMGSCGTQCDISGAGVVASGAVNPANPCESCQPGTSTSAWTSTDGSNAKCPTGDVCNGSPATCTSGCWIAGAYVASGGTANDGCEVCKPATSTTAWTDVTGPASCGAGEVCNAGSCAVGCEIAGVFEASGATANSGCEVCTPATSTTAWTDVTGPASCPAGDVCKAGSCTPGCEIAGAYVASGATTNKGCEVCDPSTSTTSWTDVDGAGTCGAGKVCSAGSCAAGCDIAGAYVTSGTTANSGCEVCDPTMSTTSWTDVFGTAGCSAGQTCNAGSCTACSVDATWSMSATSVTASPTLCQGVMDCSSGDCSDFNGMSTSSSPTDLDWSVDPGGSICTAFTGQVSASDQFTSAENNCSPAGDGSTFNGQIDLSTCSMSGTYTYVISGCTLTYTITGTQ